MIELSAVRFGYGSEPILRAVTLEVGGGELVAVVGANGAGKTTLLKLIGGLLEPDAGTVLCFGHNPRSAPRAQLARRLAYLPQSYELAFPFSVGEVVLMGRYAHRGRFALESEEDIALAREAMRACDVEDLADRRWSEVSGGERRRALLAQAMCQRAEVVLLDEPTSSLDPAHAIAFFRALKSQVEGGGLTAVVVTHDLNLCARFCSRTLLVDEGGIAADGPPGQVLSGDAARQAFRIAMHVGRLPGTDLPFVVPEAE